MNEVKTALENIQDDLTASEDFTKAGGKWAAFAAQNFTGGLLRKALEITIAISEFTNELEGGLHAKKQGGDRAED